MHSRYTIPNLVTALRMVMALVAALLALFGSDALAVAILIVAALLDVVDGWYARRYAQRSVFGAHMDPVADKILMGVVFVWIGIEAASAWVWILVALVAARETAVTVLRSFSLRRRGRFIPASRLGRVKMLTQSIVGLTALGVMHFLDRRIATGVLVAGMSLVALVSWASGAGYLMRWRGDEARRRQYAGGTGAEPRSGARVSAGR